MILKVKNVRLKLTLGLLHALLALKIIFANLLPQYLPILFTNILPKFLEIRVINYQAQNYIITLKVIKLFVKFMQHSLYKPLPYP